MHPKMRAIRQAPAEIGLLLEKVLDLNELLKQLKPTQSQRFVDGSQHTVPLVGGLDWQIARTSSKLQKLDSLIEEHASKPAHFGIDI